MWLNTCKLFEMWLIVAKYYLSTVYGTKKLPHNMLLSHTWPGLAIQLFDHVGLF